MDKFNNIRPYNNLELVDALKRIAASPNLEQVFRFLYKDGDFESFKSLLLSATSVEDFQKKIIANVVKTILANTSNGLSVSGISNVDNSRKYLYISNHRDIVMDPAIQQLVMHNNNIPTSEIAGGDNLIKYSFAEDAMRCNRMLIVSRSGSSRDVYKASVLLSEYIRTKIVSNNISIWIAQSSGRAKDGNDRTSQGILKMFDMSSSKDFVKDFVELNILPVVISYQYEPCDFLKAKELYYTVKDGKYVKSANEDIVSIVTGFTQKKGNIHFAFTEALTKQEIEKCAELDKNERFVALAELIDKRIRSNYKLWNNNYIAHDILSGSEANKDRYTPQEKEEFVNYMESGLKQISPSFDEKERDTLRNIFLSIYANPVNA